MGVEADTAAADKEQGEGSSLRRRHFLDMNRGAEGSVVPVAGGGTDDGD